MLPAAGSGLRDFAPVTRRCLVTNINRSHTHIQLPERYVDIYIGRLQMNREKDYVSLEISGEKLERMVSILRDKLMNEFWSNISEGPERERIKSRLEESILSAFDESG